MSLPNRYLFDSSATLLDATGVFRIPGDFLRECLLSFEQRNGILYLRQLIASTSGYTFTIANWNKERGESQDLVTSTLVAKATFVAESYYALHGNTVDGSALIGELAAIELQPHGIWYFDRFSAKLVPETDHLLARSIPRDVADDDVSASASEIEIPSACAAISPQGNCTYFAVSLTEITAASGINLGQGIIEFLTDIDNGLGGRSYLPTGQTTVGYNPCAVIAVDTKLQAWINAPSGTLYVTPLCAITGDECFGEDDLILCLDVVFDFSGEIRNFSADLALEVIDYYTGAHDSRPYDGRFSIILRCVPDDGYWLDFHDLDGSGDFSFSYSVKMTVVTESPFELLGTTDPLFRNPATYRITVGPCPGSGPGGTAPTVTENTQALCTDATDKFEDGSDSLINGHNFDATLGNNTVTLIDHGGNVYSTGNGKITLTSGSTTQIKMTFTTPPIAAVGAMKCIVSTPSGGSSGSPVEIANVVICGGGSGFEIIGLGTMSTAGVASSTMIKTVTVQAGLLVVNVKTLNDAGTSPPDVTFNGTQMSQAAAIGIVFGYITQFYLHVPAGTHDIVVTPGNASVMSMNVKNVIGLVNNVPDVAKEESDTFSTPDVGTSVVTATADEVALAAFLLYIPGSSWTWAGTPTFTSGGQDTNDTLDGDVYSMTEGGAILSSTGTIDAALTGVTPHAWAGLEVTYS